MNGKSELATGLAAGLNAGAKANSRTSYWNAVRSPLGILRGCLAGLYEFDIRIRGLGRIEERDIQLTGLEPADKNFLRKHLSGVIGRSQYFLRETWFFIELLCALQQLDGECT